MTLRARLLLLKQDRISQLETKLKRLDENEDCEIFLASSRDDSNHDRLQLLADLDSALADYGTFDLFVQAAYALLLDTASITPSLIALVKISRWSVTIVCFSTGQRPNVP